MSNLTEYDKKQIQKICDKYMGRAPCTQFYINELKKDLIKLYFDEEFLKGHMYTLDYLNKILDRVINNAQLKIKKISKLDSLKYK